MEESNYCGCTCTATDNDDKGICSSCKRQKAVWAIPMLNRGKGNFIHCTDYETAVEALQKQQDIIKELADSLKKLLPFADSKEVAEMNAVSRAEYLLALYKL